MYLPRDPQRYKSLVIQWHAWHLARPKDWGSPTFMILKVNFQVTLTGCKKKNACQKLEIFFPIKKGIWPPKQTNWQQHLRQYCFCTSWFVHSCFSSIFPTICTQLKIWVFLCSVDPVSTTPECPELHLPEKVVQVGIEAPHWAHWGHCPRNQRPHSCDTWSNGHDHAPLFSKNNWST